MQPMQNVRLMLGSLLAADPTTLAPAVNPNKIALVMEPFVQSEELVLADLVMASFDGYAPIAGVAGDQQVAIAPDTLEQRVTIKDPLGGYRWVSTGPTNLPQSIYGFILTTNDGLTLLASETFNEPITLTASGQEINLGSARLTLVVQPIS